jgi:hypothetical protein
MKQEQLFELPSFYCPIESAINPEIHELEKQGIEWIDAFKLANTDEDRTRLIGTYSAEFAARALPTADAVRVQPYVNWNHWGFAIDNTWDDPSLADFNFNHFPKIAMELLQAIESPARGTSSNNPLVAALQNIADSIRDYATPNQMRRLAEAHRRLFFYVQKEINHQIHNETFNFDQCMSIRPNTTGCAVAAAFIEIANPFGEISDNEMNSPAVLRINELFTMIAAIDNDIFSFHKEYFQNQQMTDNIVATAAREYHLGLQEAVEQSVAMRDRMIALFLQLRDQVTTTASRALRAYLIDLGHQIRGNIEWGLRVPRYTVSDCSSLTPIWLPNFPGWASEPSNKGLSPLLLRAISWYWEIPESIHA